MTCALLLAVAFVPAAVSDGALKSPLACAVAADGTIYLVDRGTPGVWRVGADAERPTLFKIGGRVFRTPLNAPRCVAVAAASAAFPGGAVLVGDSATRMIYQLDPTIKEPPAAPLLPRGDGPRGDGPRGDEPGPIGVPSALAVAADGTVFVADLESQRIYRIPPGEPPAPIAVLAGVRGLCLAADGGLWAVTSNDDAVRRLVPPVNALLNDGLWTMTVAVAGRPFRNPQSAALGSDGALYVADNAAACVWKLAPAPGGRFAAPVKLAAGAPLIGPTGLCLDRSTDPPRLLFADPRAKALFAIRLTDGAITTRAR